MKEQEADYFSSQVIRANRFFRRQDAEGDAAVHVIAAGFERCRPGYAIRREDFPYLALEFVSDGTGKLLLEQEETSLSRGTLFLYGPGVVHSIGAVKPPGLGKYFLNLTGPGASGLLEEAGLRPGQILQVATPGELEPLFNELIHNGLKDSPFSGRICTALVQLILLKVRENVLPFPGRNSRAYQTFSRCRIVLEERFLGLGNLEEAARECHVDSAYLCRLFKDFAHQSPYRYLVRLKLNRAAELLHDPAVLVKEAGEAVGFSDPFHFSRLFTKAFGITPTRYSRLYGRSEGGE